MVFNSAWFLGGKIMENIFKILKTRFPLKMKNTIELKNTTPKQSDYILRYMIKI